MFRINLLKIQFAFVLILLSTGVAFADGRAKISLIPSDTTNYNASDSNPWLTESWITNSNNFDLDIINMANSPIYLTKVVLSIPYNTANTGWSFTLGGTPFNYASFINTGLHPYLSPHGIFADNNGALWTEFSLGTLAAGETRSVQYSGTGLPNGMFLHFDAYGSKSATSQDGWYFAPYSHDVTVTPEPMAMVLYGMGGLPLAARIIRRRKAIKV